MTGLMLRVLRDRWQLLVGTLCAITLGVALVHSGLAIATTVAAARPPEGLDAAERAAFTARLNGANTLNGIASVLGVFLTVFVVRSTIDFATTERRRELALLRLAGVRRRQVRAMLLGEALVLGVAGSLAGAVLGLAVAAVQRLLYVRMGTLPREVTLGWQPVHLALDLGVGLTVALAGARASSRRATRIAPLDGLYHRGADEAVMSRARWVWGGLAGLATIAQVAGSILLGGFLGPLLLALGIVITGSVTASQLSPLLVPLAARLAQPLARGPLAQLAVATVRSEPRRAAQIAAPLIVLVSLVAGLQGLLDTQTAAGEREITALTRADLILTTRGDPSARVAAIPGVASADAQVEVPARVTVTQGGRAADLPGSVLAVDPARLTAMHPRPARRGSMARLDDRHIVFGPGIENMQLAETPERIDLTVGGRRHRLAEAARVGEGLAATDGFYISRALVPAAVLGASPSTVLVTLAPGADAAAVRAAVDALHLGTTATPDELAAERSAAKNEENRAVMAALVGVGSVYALISLLSTLAIATSQRRSELAVDRLTGLTRGQVLRLVLAETSLVIGIGLVLGTAVSVTALTGLWVSTWRSLGAPVIAVPWQLLGAMALGVALLAAAVCAAAARSATQHPPIHQITTQE